MAITWIFNGETQEQWDLWLNTGVRNDFSAGNATNVDPDTFKEEDYEAGDIYEFVVDSQFAGSAVYSWDDEVWKDYIGGTPVALTFQNDAWDNKNPVYVYIRKTPVSGDPVEYAAYQVFVDSFSPIFGAAEITVDPALARNPETHAVVEHWYNKADVVAVGGEDATGATLTITFDDGKLNDADLRNFLSSGIVALKYSTNTDDPEDEGDWSAFDHEIAVDPKNIKYDEEKHIYTLTAYLPDSVDGDGDGLAEGTYFRFKLVDGVGNVSDEIKVFKAPVDDTAEILDYVPQKYWQDATAPAIADPSIATITAVHVDNNVAQVINGHPYDPEDLEFHVITDRNKPGTPYQFTLSGVAPTQASDKGTALNVVVTYTVNYQELVSVDGNYSLGELQTFSGEIDTAYDGGGAWNTDGKPLSLYPKNVGAQAIGYYDIVVKVVDEAGNESAFDNYYVYFDNTLPASPDVVLFNGELPVAIDEDTKSSYLKAFGEETFISVAPGSYGELAEGLHDIPVMVYDAPEEVYDGTPIYKYAADTGITLENTDIAALVAVRNPFDPADWEDTPGQITLDNIDNIWGGSTYVDPEDEKTYVKDNSYSVIFFTQNEYGIESSTFVDQVSVVRFVVDTNAPTDLDMVLGPGATVEGGINWFSNEGAAVSLTFSAVDKWHNMDAGTFVVDDDRVSGIDTFTISGISTPVKADAGTYVIENVRSTNPGIVEYDFVATDAAGNDSAAYSATHDLMKIGIDAAAPEINNVYVRWGAGENDKREIEGDTIVFTADDLAYFAEEGINNFWLDIAVVDVNGAEEGDKTGIGLDLDPANSYYQYFGELGNHEFTPTENGTKTEDRVIGAGNTYKYLLQYSDKLGHDYDELKSYTVIFDAGADFDVAGTYQVNGPAAVLGDKGPTVSDVPVAAFEALDKYAKAFDLAFAIDSESGIQSWTLTKAGVEDPIFSYDAAKGVVPVAFALDSTDAEARELWKLEEGVNEYTFTIQDKAGNEPVVQNMTLKYDASVTGTVQVIDQNEKEITRNADGKFYVTTNNYKLVYGAVDTEENPELSGADLVFFREDGDPEYDNHPLGLGWYHGVYTKADGSDIVHEAIVTDKAGNQDAVNARAEVVVDQTKPVIFFPYDTYYNVLKAIPTGQPGAVLATQEVYIDELTPLTGEGVTIGWTNWVDDNSIRIQDANLASLTINGEEMEIIGPTYNYHFTAATWEQGENVLEFVATDKAGNVTTGSFTVKFDSIAPVADAANYTVDGHKVSTDIGGVDAAEAHDNPLFVADVEKFYFDMKATDANGIKQYFSYSANGIGWSAWTEYDSSTKITEGSGYYRFASIDEAGNSTLSETVVDEIHYAKYYFVDQVEFPTKPVISYIDVEGTPYTDVDDKGWFTKGIQVLAEFETGHSYDQWNFIAKDFDKDAYTLAYQEAVAAGDDKPQTAALLAAVHSTDYDWKGGKWNEEFVVTVQKTDAGSTWTWEGPQYEESPITYYMFSINEADDSTLGQWKEQVVKVDTSVPVITLTGVTADGEDYAFATWTNQDVTVDMTVESPSKIVSESVHPVTYTTEGQNSYQFSATNEAGTTGKKSADVWIDKTAPVIERTDDYAGTWSKDPVTITATATDALSGVDGATTFEKTVSEEGETPVEWTVTDLAGNVSETMSVLVKIDTTAPELTLDAGDYVFGEWTNKTVTVIVTATDNLSGVKAQTESPVVFEEEGAVLNEFFAEDYAGNKAFEARLVRIDKTAPVITRTDSYESGTWSKDPVTISATMSDALSGLVTPETFSQTYTESQVVVITAKDAAGNEVKEEVVVLIDNGVPVITLDAGAYVPGTWTNQNVTIDMTVTSSSPIVDKTETPVVVSEEGSKEVEFFATNEAGNTATASMLVKIDKTDPEVKSVTANPSTGHAVAVTVTAVFEDKLGGSGIAYGEYSIDNSAWSKYTEPVTVSHNGTVSFRAFDNAGNVSKVESITIDNIRLSQAEVSGEGSGTQEFDDTNLYSGEYELGGDFGEITGKVTILNKGKSVFTATLDGGEIKKTSTKDGKFMLDVSTEEGENDIEVKIDVNDKKTAGSREYDIEIFSDDDRFIKGYNGDDTAAKAQEKGALSDGDQGWEIVDDEWVGFGDTIDYFAFELEGSASLKFDFKAEDTAKMTVYQFNGLDKKGNIKLKSLGNVTVSAKELDTTKSTKDLLLASGQYYIAVETTNKKLGAGNYDVTVNESSVFYPADADLNLNNQTWKTASVMDEDLSTRWVGFGDAADFYKFSVDDDGKIKFELDEVTAAAVANKELKITCLTDTGKSVALDKINGTSIETKKSCDAGDYILGVTCANVKKFNTYYDVTIA